MTATAGNQNHKDTILVADDEAHLRKILKFHLESTGFRVVLAEDGVEAIEVAKREQPALILLDLMMPRMSGNEVIRELKVEMATRFIPVIILTAKMGSEVKLRQLEDGAQDFITKPFSLNEVVVRVKNVIAWSRMQRHANPLTGLPGNVSIEEELTRRIIGKEAFAFLYVDLDNFKAYNDHYGYHRGDQAIFALSRILMSTVRDAGRREDFVGHVGGDDFVIVSTPDRADQVAAAVTRQFEKTVSSLYDAEDVTRGHIEVTNRVGAVQQFPLLTLTMVCVTNDQIEIEHVAQASDIAADLKRHAKTLPGNSYVRDRRGRVVFDNAVGVAPVELGSKAR